MGRQFKPARQLCMRRRSRLIRKQEEKNIRRAILYIFLTLALAGVLIFAGIPLLIKMAIFLGNLRSSSKLPEKQDEIPPAPPRLVVPFEATNSAQFSLKGYTESGATVKLFNSSLSFGEVVADNEGNFSLEGLKLTTGRNEITAVAIDSEGNESQASLPETIDYDTTPPALEITSPENETTITGLEKELIIRGRTEEGVRVTINDRLVIVGPGGDFNYQYSLQEGENSFRIVAQDEAGNQTTQELKITYSP